MNKLIILTLSLSLAAPASWAGSPVFANGVEIAGKSSHHSAGSVFPDVSFTPPQQPATPPGVPIPYPNMGTAADTATGGVDKQVGGKVIRPKFHYHVPAPKQPPAPRVLMPSNKQGKTYFQTYPYPNVKTEPPKRVRQVDLVTKKYG